MTVKIILEGVNDASDEIKAVLGDLKKMGVVVEEADKKTKKHGGTVKDMKMTYLAFAGAAVAAGIAVKKAFDFAKEGAAIEQTTQSWDGLLQRLGMAPDYLDRLSEASRGTIDNVSLMASTLTLVAGVGDDMAKSMLEVAPRILEIAKAANKLNPTLGTTSFMYESLMRGIKRSSPLLIDNTGLVLKIGEANKKYADSLGKSVDELTANEKQMALLNATLEAGDILIQQVGGSVDSATDSFAQLEAQIKNTTNEIKQDFAPSAEKVVEWAGEQAKAYDAVATARELLTQAEDAGLITSWEHAKAFQLFTMTTREAEDIIVDYTQRLEDNRIVTEMAEYSQSQLTFGQQVQNEALREARQAQIDYSKGLLTLSDDTDMLRGRIDESLGVYHDMTGVLEMTGDSFDDAAGGAYNFAGGLKAVSTEWSGITTLGSLEARSRTSGMN